MREELAKREGARGEFSATFERYGRKTGWKGREETTLLFANVQDASGLSVADHIWFRMTKEFERLCLRPGEKIKFNARVRPYWKGYEGRGEFEDGCGQEKDYGLSFPTKVQTLGATPADMGLFAGVACAGCGRGTEGGKRLCAACSKKMD